MCILRNQESACIYDSQKNSLVMNKNAEHCNTHHIILPEAAVSQHSMPLTLRCSFLFFSFLRQHSGAVVQLLITLSSYYEPSRKKDTVK